LGTQASNEQLMLAFKSGDAAAFATLVSRHRQPVFNFILRYVGHRQRAEDVLQETWLKVLRNSAEYQPKAKFSTWVYTIARNLCVDCARKESFRKTESIESSTGSDGSGPTLAESVPDRAAPSPARVAHNAQLRPLIERAITSLPLEQREVFLLREIQGIGFKEIAEMTEVNENTVKSRMRYALDGLRKRMLELGVDAEMLVEGRTVA
jgi:RNA polymerase sigma-70 factor (ECF subfamily)